MLPRHTTLPTTLRQMKGDKKMALKAGFARVNITPPMGINLAGYYIKREADHVLDDLYAVATAINDGNTTAVLVGLDAIYVAKDGTQKIRDFVSEELNIPPECIFIGCSHPHTAPIFQYDHPDEKIKEYFKSAKLAVRDAAKLAIDDLRDAKVGYGIGNAPRIAFSRRFRMKDGSVRTNPGVKNPDILEAIGEIDERVSVVRFNRECDDIVLINFACHPDTIGGTGVSADWPGFAKRTVEAAIPGTKCIFFNGAQGDVNHVNVFPCPGEENGLHKDFDDVDRGYLHARHMGNVVAGAVLQVFEKVAWCNENDIKVGKSAIKVPANRPSPDEIPLATKYSDLHAEGRDDEIPFKGMQLTTVLADSARILRLKDGPDFFEIPVTAISIGDIVLIGIPGEPFSSVGMAIKAVESRFGIIIPCALTGGMFGYFPNTEAYNEGGYETATSNYKSGVAEVLTEEIAKLIRKL